MGLSSEEVEARFPVVYTLWIKMSLAPWIEFLRRRLPYLGVEKPAVSRLRLSDLLTWIQREASFEGG